MYKSYITPSLLSHYRMLAQIANKTEHSNKLLTEQHVASIRSHKDINIVTFAEIDYNHLNYLILQPNFLQKFETFVLDIIFDIEAPFNDKIRLLGYLTSVRMFNAKTRQQAEDSMKQCFDTLLYLRFSENGVTSLSKQSQNRDKFNPDEIPIFRKPENDIIKSILMLMMV